MLAVAEFSPAKLKTCDRACTLVRLKYLPPGPYIEMFPSPWVGLFFIKINFADLIDFTVVPIENTLPLRK